MAKKTVLTIECAGCGAGMGTKDGQGVEGVTSSFCDECLQIERLKLAQHLVKTKGLSWAVAKREAGMP